MWLDIMDDDDADDGSETMCLWIYYLDVGCI
jgi:hypothetical protein